MTPVIRVSYAKLMNPFKSVRRQNSTSNPFGFVCIGPKYWLGQLNFGGIIAHIILLQRTQKFFNKSLLPLDCVLTQKMA